MHRRKFLGMLLALPFIGKLLVANPTGGKLCNIKMDCQDSDTLKKMFIDYGWVDWKGKRHFTCFREGTPGPINVYTGISHDVHGAVVVYPMQVFTDTGWKSKRYFLTQTDCRNKVRWYREQQWNEIQKEKI